MITVKSLLHVLFIIISIVITILFSLFILEESNKFSKILHKHRYLAPLVSIIPFVLYLGFIAIDIFVDFDTILESNPLTFLFEHLLHSVIAIDVASTLGMNFVVLYGTSFVVFIVCIYCFIKQKLISSNVSAEDAFSSLQTEKKDDVLYLKFSNLRI